MLNRDETESWEDSIDKEDKPKFKYPIEFEDCLLEINLDNMAKVEIKIPVNLKKTITKIIDIRKGKNKKKGLF